MGSGLRHNPSVARPNRRQNALMPSSNVASNLESLRELPLRRVPRQQRSRRRVANMISAAIDLLVLGGTEAVTTSAVAEKAGVPIGSVYQFFPDRETLLLAVAEISSRPLQETAELINSDSIPGSDLDSWLVSVLNQLEDQWSKHPADVAAWNALVSVPNMDAVTGPIFTNFVNALAQGVTQHNKSTRLSEKETNELCWVLTTSLTAVLSSSLAMKRTSAMAAFKIWATCMFTPHA